jgi:cytochrome c oxidase cbb3-type subunit 4
VADFYAWLKSLWVVWLIALFVGIVVWAYWPSRKKKMDEHAKIPFHEDDEKRK